MIILQNIWVYKCSRNKKWAKYNALNTKKGYHNNGGNYKNISDKNVWNVHRLKEMLHSKLQFFSTFSWILVMGCVVEYGIIKTNISMALLA